MTNVPNTELDISHRAPKLLHPKCPTPGWWARRKMHVELNDEWTCPVCGIVHVWESNGFGAIFWHTKFGDADKSLVVHFGYEPLPFGSQERREELEALKARFWETR